MVGLGKQSEVSGSHVRVLRGISLACPRALARIVVMCLVLPLGVSSLEVPARPAQPVYDAADLLTAADESRLVQRMVTFERESSTQIAVATFASLDGESLEDFTIRLAEAWRPGDQERSNGVILAVFVAERRMRIEVGYGLEGALPDALCGRIIRDEIRPAFRGGDFALGIDRGVTAIMDATRGEYEPRTDRGGRPDALGHFPLLMFVAIVVLVMRGLTSRGRHRTYRGGGWFGGWGIGGTGGGGGGGSGFGGFGGGSFGGGGASGGW